MVNPKGKERGHGDSARAPGRERINPWVTCSRRAGSPSASVAATRRRTPWPTAGEILFAGHAWRREDLYAIGSLIEEAPLYPNLTARENLRVRTTLLGLPESRVDEVLAAVDLADTGKKRAGRFSMGMRQRLGLALALIARPRLLVLDEPTNGLDPIGIEELRDQIRGFAAAGTTVIVSSHILSEVQQMADTIGIIYGGRLAYEDALRPGQDLEELFMSVCREGRRARGEVAA